MEERKPTRMKNCQRCWKTPGDAGSRNFIMYAAVAVILGGTLACTVFEIEELRYSLYIGFFIAFVGAVISAPHSKSHKSAVGRGDGSRGTERCF